MNFDKNLKNHRILKVFYSTPKINNFYARYSYINDISNMFYLCQTQHSDIKMLNKLYVHTYI